MMKTICKHFVSKPSGADPECKRGHVPKALVGGNPFGIGTRLPCNSLEPKGGPKGVCVSKQLPTDEEYNAHRQKWDELSAWAITTAIAIKENHKSGDTGSIACPKCQGTMNFSISPSNGHVHARCETDDCLFFME